MRTPVSSVRPSGAAFAAPGTSPAPPSTPPAWRWVSLWLAPHRLAFFAGTMLLVMASLWWAAVQVDRVTGWWGLAYAISPTLTHAAVMVMGFMPLFFAGFLFTAGPKWLGVAGPAASALTWPVLAQALGWALWLAGAHLHQTLAVAGLAMATLGLSLQYRALARLWRASAAQDRVHATVVTLAGAWGVWCLLALTGATALSADGVAMAWVHSALWGFVVVTYVAVAHRMLPFFTSAALPMIHVWRPFWVLWLMLGAAMLEVLSVWMPWSSWGNAPGWHLVRGALELLAGGVLVWLAWAWGLAQSLKIRLLAMLHLGFLWLGLSWLMSGASQWVQAAGGSAALGLGALHALSMGFLGSILLAMVTRVACGHSGRALVADATVWGLFWGLQLAVLLRLVGAVPGTSGPWLLVTAVVWAFVMLVWGSRLIRWYGRPRVDGRPG